VQRRNTQVSPGWLGAAVFGTLGLLGSGPAPEEPAPAAEVPTALVLEAAQPPSFGCRVAKELRFEMLPANADLPLPTPRRTPVCLAVYRPR